MYLIYDLCKFMQKGSDKYISTLISVYLYIKVQV